MPLLGGWVGGRGLGPWPSLPPLSCPLERGRARVGRSRRDCSVPRAVEGEVRVWGVVVVGELGASPLVPPRRRGAAPRRLCPRSSCRAARRRSSLRVWWAAGSLGCASAPTPLSTALQARTPCAGVHPARCPTVSYLVDPASSICLSQRLSHACLSTHGRYSETANGSLNQLWFLWSLAPLLLG